MGLSSCRQEGEMRDGYWVELPRYGSDPHGGRGCRVLSHHVALPSDFAAGLQGREIHWECGRCLRSHSRRLLHHRVVEPGRCRRDAKEDGGDVSVVYERGVRGWTALSQVRPCKNSILHEG